MNVERCCYCFLISILPILYLPSLYLWLGFIWGTLLLCYAGVRQDKLLGLTAIFILQCYIRVSDFAENLHKQTAYTSQEQIHIQRILKQEGMPSAIAQREDGSLVYLWWQAETALFLDQKYFAELRLRPISARLNEGNFNRQRWYIAQHISATATVKTAQKLTQPSQGFRASWLTKIAQQTQEFTSQGVILALAFGERAWLNPQHWQYFQHTATAHLVAISGLHIALVFALGFGVTKGGLYILGSICYRFQLKQAVKNPYFFAILGGFLTAWGYSFLAGFSIPTVRAVIAISLILGCRLSRRYYTAGQLWLRCVTLLIVLDPFCLLSDSFWLSILAVAGLICWYRYFPLSHFSVFERLQKIWGVRYLVQLIHLQIGIAFCFLPVQLYFFDGLSAWAFVANLLVVPLFSLLVVPLILFSLLSNNLLQSWAWVDWLLQINLDVLEYLSTAWLPLSQIMQWRLVCLALFFLLIAYYRELLRSRLSLIIVTTLALYQCGSWWLNVAKSEVAWIHFDVGQGLAMAFVYTDENGKRKVVLYDTGAGWQGGSMAEIEILPYLRRNGLTLEAIIVSHDDNDHAGGVRPLLQYYPHSRLILSAKNRYSPDLAEACVAGKQWQFGQLRFTAVYPYQVVERAKNADSCVLVGEIGQYRILLTGDSGTAQEREFAMRVGKIDFLQVGHHGSKTSTSYTLLAATQPQAAFISASRFNPWKMPSLSVTTRLDKLGIQHFNTADKGMITVLFERENYRIKTARNHYSPWYSDYFAR